MGNCLKAICVSGVETRAAVPPLTESRSAASPTSLVSPPAPLAIGSFNVQKFGWKKASNDAVLRVIARIVSRYDLCFLQELFDADGRVTGKLLEQLQQMDPTYQCASSQPCGRSSNKERYAYVYKTRRLELLDSYTYDDAAAGDAFEREPFIVRFRMLTGPAGSQGQSTLQVIGCHIKPGDAKRELHRLPDVHADMQRRYGLVDPDDNTVLLGDFNADGRYLKSADRANPMGAEMAVRFRPVMAPREDTTVGAQSLAYDRIFVTHRLATSVVPSATHAYRFDELMGLDRAEALRVSDHYPVEFRVNESSVDSGTAGA